MNHYMFPNHERYLNEICDNIGELMKNKDTEFSNMSEIEFEEVKISILCDGYMFEGKEDNSMLKETFATYLHDLQLKKVYYLDSSEFNQPCLKEEHKREIERYLECTQMLKKIDDDSEDSKKTIISEKQIKDVYEKMLGSPFQLRTKESYTYIRSCDIHYYIMHTQIHGRLNRLINDVNEDYENFTENQYDVKTHVQKSIELLSKFIVRFLNIHPFEDGNGRISRLLANHMFSRLVSYPLWSAPIYLYLVYPPGIKRKYMKSLIQSNTDYNLGIKCMCKTITQSLNLVLKKMVTDISF